MTAENAALGNARSRMINRLIEERDYRAAYVRAKLDVLIPSQLRALRLRRDLTQPTLAEEAGMKQSRISAMETPGRVNFNLETLVRLAATFGVGLMVKFVPFSEMLRWENDYSQDAFNVTEIGDDIEFKTPSAASFNNAAILQMSLGHVPAVNGVMSSSLNGAILYDKAKTEMAPGGLDDGKQAARTNAA